MSHLKYHILPTHDGSFIVRADGSSTPEPIGTNLLEAFKALSLKGKLHFKEKQLVCDLFGKTRIRLIVHEGFTIEAQLYHRDEWISFSNCDFVGPNFFIKGVSLKFINSELSKKEIKKLLQYPDLIWTTEEIDDLKSECEVVFEGNAKEQLEHQRDPVPLLKLTDRTGAFASLFMDYGDSVLSFHSPSSNGVQRQKEAEKNWERDLLETGFIKKEMAASHYYCPLDKVAKSLSFLLELGWQIKDYKDNRLARFTGSSLEAKEMPNIVSVKGKLSFEKHQAALSDVAGAFVRRERFLNLGEGVVGLMPENWQGTGLTGLFEEGEIGQEEISIKKSNLGTLKELFDQPIAIDPSLHVLRKELRSFQGITETKPDTSFLGTLRPYQQEAVNWLHFLHTYGLSGILADDMGLGKTVQCLAFLSLMPKNAKILIVLPTSLMFNWKREIERFLPQQRVSVHHRDSRLNEMEDGIVLTTYATLRNDLGLFQKCSFECIVLDEAQTIKNADSQTAKALYQMQARFKLAITGTPIENHLKDLWSLFRFLIPELLGNEQTFLADVHASGADPRYLQRIKRQINPFFLRRKKEEVAKDLPEKIEQVVWVELPKEQREIYDSYLSSVKSNPNKKKVEIFEALLRLRQICCHPLLISSQLEEGVACESGKLQALLADVETMVEEGKKGLIYSQFTSMLHLIGKALQERGIAYVYLDGSTTNREKVVDQFQTTDVPVFLISLKAGGVGLNLTAADYVFLFDPWWNEAAENQAINRAHRIGRHDTVIAKRYVAVETLEEKIMKLKEHKRSLLEGIFEGGNFEITGRDLEELLN